MKRLNETALASSFTVKRRRTGSTPSRPKNLTPSCQTPGVKHCTSHAKAKCKASDLGYAFLKSKKLTKSNSTTIYNTITEKGRDVVEFECGTESFYKIMTHYFPALSMTPEDIRYKELKKNLFTLVMSRTEYTQVIIILNLAYISIEKFLTIKIKTHSQNIICIYFQLWVASTLAKSKKAFGYYIEDMKKDGTEPDAFTIIMMSHYLGRNITLISRKADKWSTEDINTDILLLYRGDNVYAPTDVGK